MSKSTQLSDSNRLVAQYANLLYWLLNAQEKDESDLNLIAGL